MRNFLKFLLIFLIAAFLVSGTAMASVYTYGDMYANWPGELYPSGMGDLDENGWPRIEDVTITTYDSDESLKTIEITMANRLIFDSLFINNDWTGETNDWDSWNYYVKDTAADDTGETLYDVSNGYNYTYADAGRIGHANGIDLDVDPAYPTPGGLSEVHWAGLAPWKDAWNDYVLTYTFGEGAIVLGDYFVVGYSPYCANDVFLTPVSEPATMLLLGTALICMAGLGRKKFFK